MKRGPKPIVNELIKSGIDVFGIWEKSRSLIEAAENIGVSYCALQRWTVENGVNRRQCRRTHAELKSIGIQI